MLVLPYLKLVSTNPDRFEPISDYEIIAGYMKYLFSLSDLIQAKSIFEWLETEI
jgi:hypothetical protein